MSAQWLHPKLPCKPARLTWQQETERSSTLAAAVHTGGWRPSPKILAVEITHDHTFQINFELTCSCVSDVQVDTQAARKKGPADSCLYPHLFGEFIHGTVLGLHQFRFDHVVSPTWLAGQTSEKTERREEENRA